MKQIFTFLLIASLLFSCNKAKILNVKIIDLPENGEEIISGGNSYGFEVFKEINDAETDENKNIMYSPLSLNTIFYMLYNGASGTTADEIKEAYKLQGIDILNINQTNKTITKEFAKIDRNINFNIANSIWAELDLTLNSDFSSVVKDNYEAEIENLSFSDPNSVEIINNWVKKKTEGKIPKLFDALKGNLIFVNALYFYGEWHSKFDENLTQNRDFYLADSSKTQVPTMEMTDFVDFATNEKYIIVELPYSQGNFVMDLILPQNDNTTDSILDILPTLNSMTKELTIAQIT
ncbi:MAG: serpin family protein, partial [Bacteroidota bacterium]|nr:serpin family protein [Bacteroidota bacterium]